MIPRYHSPARDKPRFNLIRRIMITMAFENGALDATLAAAAGNDPALVSELRGAFLESANKQLDLLRRSRCDGNWHVAAMRLKGLAASFHVEDLLIAADNALASAPGEPAAIRNIESILAKFDNHGPRRFQA
jgi:HPt (histidine-containing phosphotransfer) domain-containing protein